MADGTFVTFLSRSLGALRAESPIAHARLARILADLSVELCVDGERIGIESDARDLALGFPLPAPDVTLATGRRAILALIDGHATLASAVIQDEVRLWGAPGHILSALDALHAYLDGAVRSHTCSALLAQFRGDTKHHAAN